MITWFIIFLCFVGVLDILIHGGATIIFWIAFIICLPMIICDILNLVDNHKNRLRIRSLIEYQMEHATEVPTLLEIMEEHQHSDPTIEKIYNQELARYKKVHELE